MLLNTDSLEYMRALPDNAFDLLFTDPPYGKGVAKMAFTRVTERMAPQQSNYTSRRYQVKSNGYAQKEWDNKTPTSETFSQMVRISRHQIIFGIDYFTSLYNFGTGRIEWDKMVPKAVSFKGMETAYCSLVTGTDTISCLWSGMMQAKSAQEPTKQQGNKRLNEKRIHPTQKPVILGELILGKYAQQGWTVFDPYAGSGSFLVACKKLGLEYTGCEIDTDYYNAAITRL